MVFLIVAAPVQKGSNEKQVESDCKQCISPSGKSISDLSTINVSFSWLTCPQIDKTKFKVGTLDSLMELNDALGKVDITLDGNVKKMEKQLKELDPNKELKIETNSGACKHE